MTKLLQAIRTSPTQKNIDRLSKHMDKHPMAICMVSKEDLELVKSLGL